MKKLNLTLSITIFAAAAGFAGSAGADTMYKCTGASGKVTFTDQPCAGQGKASTLDVRPPLRDAEVAQKAEADAEKLKRANEHFKVRAAERERMYADQEQKAAQARADRERWAIEARARQEAKDRETARQGVLARRERERFLGCQPFTC
ncbi:protein of unknown function [Duganella sp. CF458]|uniref:DUF4124 domain-containing protein n=1 Tax=Duganella sp. CF458 TaxID=1884368 RepID=UPI0008E16ADF|nr:DUF4124 domain-containing protein [Duganella sp. CF458]SFG34385.1 protein of unknown function [Duganella sp. CF458]